MNKEQIENIFLETETLLNGHFILTSGKHSDQYMQCAKVTQFPKHTELLVKVIAEGFAEDNINVIVGPATGGIIVAYELASVMNVKNMFAERVDGKMELRRGFEIKKGDRVVIAEDVITTGGSVQEVIDLVKELGGDVVGVGVLVDRSMGKADFGVKLVSCYKANVVAYEPDKCPLCKAGKINAVKPGSRNL